MSNYIPVPVNKMLTLFNKRYKRYKNRSQVNKKSRKRQPKKKT